MKETKFSESDIPYELDMVPSQLESNLDQEMQNFLNESKTSVNFD